VHKQAGISTFKPKQEVCSGLYTSAVCLANHVSMSGRLAPKSPPYQSSSLLSRMVFEGTSTSSSDRRKLCRHAGVSACARREF